MIYYESASRDVHYINFIHKQKTTNAAFFVLDVSMFEISCSLEIMTNNQTIYFSFFVCQLILFSLSKYFLNQTTFKYIYLTLFLVSKTDLIVIKQ